MSVKAMSWALNDAPVEQPGHVLVLVAMAERAGDDGTGTWQSVATIASKARISVRTCQRILRELVEGGLITLGDQRHVQHLPGNHRPVVYNLSVHLNRGAKMAPVDSAGVPNQSSRGAKSESRGAKSDTLGVPLLADESSLRLVTSDSKDDSSPRKRGPHFIPADFEVTAEMQAWVEKTYPRVDWRWETQKLKGWGKENKRTNWAAVWKRWMSNAADKLHYSPAQVPTDVRTPLTFRDPYLSYPTAQVVGDPWAGR